MSPATSALKAMTASFTSRQQVRIGLLCCILGAILVWLPTGTEAYPLTLGNDITRKHPVTMEIENPEEVLSVLDNLMQNILVGIDFSHSNNLINEKSPGNKRGIDLGLSRGFSGSQAAKHLMGMSAASFANGPGRRRK